MKKIILALFVTLLLGCASMFEANSITEFSSDNGYLGVYLEKNYYIKFLNLDTEEIIEKNLKEAGGLVVVELPVGEYAIEYLRLGHKFSGNAIPVPLTLKTIISIEANTMLFLGDIKTDIEYSSNITYYMIRHDYSWEEALFEVESNYYYDEDFRIVPLEQLSLENIQESKFDFEL